MIIKHKQQVKTLSPIVLVQISIYFAYNLLVW